MLEQSLYNKLVIAIVDRNTVTINEILKSNLVESDSFDYDVISAIELFAIQNSQSCNSIGRREEQNKFLSRINDDIIVAIDMKINQLSY